MLAPAVAERLTLVINHVLAGEAGGHRAPAPARRPHAGADARRLAGAAAAAAGAGLARHAGRPARLVRRPGRAMRPTWRCASTPPTRRCCWSRVLGGEPPAGADRRRRAAGRRRELAAAEPALGRRRRPRPPVRPGGRRSSCTGWADAGRALRAAMRGAAELAERCARAAPERRARERRDAAARAAGLHRRHRPALRPGRGGAVGLPRSAGCARWCAWSPSAAGWTRRAASACARALERLGPIFVKFGQVLSTRRDLLPLDVADELARLQDRVPPFPAAQSRALVEKAFGRPHRRGVRQLRRRAGGQRVDRAGALRACCKDGREVAVKVLRPGMLDVIDDDLACCTCWRAGSSGCRPTASA